MSVYFVAQWSVRQPNVEECEKALDQISEHIKSEHPAIKSIQVYRQVWGPFARRAYFWMEEYESLSALESERSTSACAEVWKPIENMAQDGTYVCSMWSDPNRSLWFSR